MFLHSLTFSASGFKHVVIGMLINWQIAATLQCLETKMFYLADCGYFIIVIIILLLSIICYKIIVIIAVGFCFA